MTAFTDILAKNIADDFGIIESKIVDMMKLSFFKDRKHKYYKGYKSYSFQELDKYFGRSNFAIINDVVGIFDVLPYCYRGKYTRGIKPSTKLVECFNKAIDQWLPVVDELEHETFSKSGGIASRDVNNNNTKFKSNIMQAVQVDVEALANLTKITPTSDRESRIKVQAAVMLDLALDKKHLPKKWIPQRYIQHKTGRLYSDGVSLQNCCREVRYSALNGMYSFDIDNCHYSILFQTTKALTPSIKHYLSNKKVVRNTLARDLNLPVDDIKQILISLIFGASLSPYKPGNAIADICKNATTYGKVLSNKLIQGLHKDVTKAGKELIATNTVKSKRHYGKVKNIMGLVCEDRTPSKKLSHLLQGYEVKALEIVTTITKTDTAALLHDGWVTYSAHDKSVFEKAIHEQIGLVLSVDFSFIECKYYSSSKSATDSTNTDTQRVEQEVACKLKDRGVPELLSSFFLLPKSILTKLSQPTFKSIISSKQSWLNFASKQNRYNIK